MEDLLTQLKLARVRQVYPEWIDKAAKEEMSYADFLKGLLMEEICARQENQIQRRMRQAGFPFEKTIEQFDFGLRPELKRQVILNCMDETFIHQGRSLMLLGPPGVGKTHLSISVGIRMIQLGYQVKFVMAQRLVNDYVQQPQTRQKIFTTLAKTDLLIIDEFGYLPYQPEVAPLFYQLISDRYEQKGTIITSNKSLRAWAEVLHNASLAAALIDRLMHHGEVFYLSGSSYRLRGKQKYLEEKVMSPGLESTQTVESERNSERNSEGNSEGH